MIRYVLMLRPVLGILMLPAALLAGVWVGELISSAPRFLP